MSTTLPLFWHLSAASKKERIDASVKLVSALELFQSQFTPAAELVSRSTKSDDENYDDEGDEASRKGEDLDLLNAQDVSYSIRRLVRGLSSPRESSRLGFAVALTELLGRIDTITATQIIKLIVDGTVTAGAMSGQEERDMLFARLFGLTAIIKSGMLARKGSLKTSTSSAAEISTADSFHEIIVLLVALGEKKSWLRESAWWTAGLAIDFLEGASVEWKEIAVEALLNTIFVEDKSWTPEKVALNLKLQGYYPGKDWKLLCSPLIKNGNVLAPTNLQTLAKILKESPLDEEDTKTKTSAATWKPQIHYVWDVILDFLLPNENGSQKQLSSAQEFFKIVVDESLFSATSSQQKKYWGFQVFSKALKRVDQNSMPMLFTRNFMRSWINHLSNSDRYLHKLAKQLVSEVQTFVQSNPQLGFALILQLTGVNGSRQFDKITRTKTVETVLSSMTPEGVEEYINYLLNQISEHEGAEEVDIQTVMTRRTWIIEQFGALIRNTSIPKNDVCIRKILDWLTIHGLFFIKKGFSKSPFKPLHFAPNPPFSDELRRSCRTRLLSSLSDLTTQVVTLKIDGKTTKATGVASDGEPWLSKVLTTIQQLEATKYVNLLTEADEEEATLRKDAIVLAKRLGSPDQEVGKGLELLLMAIVLQNYCVEEDEEMDMIVLESCIDASSRMFPENKKEKKGRKTAQPTEELPEPVDVLTDIIIGFLEKSTTYLRTIANHVFGLVSPKVTDSAVDLILSQLERLNPAELATNEDEEEEEEMDIDEAEKSGEDNEDSEIEESEASGDSGNESGDETDPEEPVDAELRKKIEQALRVNGADDESDESDDEVTFDDDQMMAIDEHLVAAFRSRINEKKPGKDTDAQREATHFKNRVLDLVDMFLRRQPTSPLALRFIGPLIDLVAHSGLDEKQLSDKAKGIIRSRVGKAKEYPTSDVTLDQVSGLSQDFHTRARKVHSPELLAILSLSCIYFAKILQGLEGGESVAFAHYRESIEDFLARKNSSLNAAFFQDIFRRSPALAWNLRTPILSASTNAVNVYRQCQAYSMLEILVSQLSTLNVSEDEIRSFMSAIQDNIIQIIDNAISGTTPFTSTQLKELLKLVFVAVRQTQRISTKKNMSISSIWNADLWMLSKSKLAESTRFSASIALQKLCEQIAQASRLPEKVNGSEKSSKVSLKRKASQVEKEAVQIRSEPKGDNKKMKRGKTKKD